jgi:acetylglutamate kinase
MALMQSAELIKKIGSIGKAQTKLTKDIQLAAVNAVGYSIEYGDITIAQRLYDALGTGIRRQSLVAFFREVWSTLLVINREEVCVLQG